MKKNNNKGSSLILAIVLFAVLLTIGGAVLTIINTNYKVRVKEGKRLQNLYESDAGLDVAYNILVKTFEAGIKSGSDSVGSIDPVELEEAETTKEKAEIINSEFKKGFTEVVTIDEIIKSIEGNKYIKDYKENDEYNKYQIVEFNSSNEEYPKLTCNVNKNNEEYTVTVLSEFESDESKSSTGKNIRQVQVVYELKVPDYENAVEVDMSSKIEKVEELKGKIIGIDGNMNVSGNIDLNIEGDIFVKGEKEADKGYNLRVYDKYNGGITLNNESNHSTKLTVKGNVITPKTFNIANSIGNITTMMEGNLYAGNIYIGNKDGSYSQNNTTRIKGDVIVDNDLAMKGKQTFLDIDNFYGINDKTYEVDYSESPSDFQTKTRVSSSIIVNGDDEEGTIKINNNAYIMGTAYIDAQNKDGDSYRTGESVAVKGNYIAYTKREDTNNKYDFDLYGPLQLIDSKNGEKLEIDQKSAYFEEFVNKPTRSDKICTGGVILPENTKAVGAILYKRIDENGKEYIQAKRDTPNIGDTTIDTKIKEYTTNVYCMGVLDSNNQDYISIYNQLGAKQKTIQDLIYFDDKKTSTVKGDLVLNHDPSRTVYLTDDSNSIKSEVKANDIIINVDNEKDMMILTNGNVEVCVKEKLKYNGMIISTKNIDISGSGNVIMKYDESVINKVIARNSSELKDIFNNKTIYNLQQTENSIPVYSHQYDIKKYIQSKDWKIVR